MGTTYLVKDLLSGEEIALKLLDIEQPGLLKALRDEFSTLSGLIHKNICKVHDFGCLRDSENQTLAFYTCDFIDGETLDLFAAGRSWSEVRRPIVDTLEALRFLHHLEIRHGDVKPSNILVDKAGRGVLIDLGCARPLGHQPDETVAGTPGYIAPELLRGAAGDHRSDLFGIGVTLWEILEGLSAPRSPAHVERLVRRLVAEKPSLRPSDSGEVLELLGAPGDRLGSSLGQPAKLVGREDELALFSSMLEAMLSGEPGARALYLTGPEGIGRTRLLQELKWHAQLRCTTVEGRHDGGAIESMLERATGQSELPGGVRGAFTAREALNSAEESLVLVVDDVQRLDEAQREVLHGLLRSIEESDRFMVLCTGHKAPKIASRAVRRWELSTLTGAEVSTWAEGRLSGPMLTEIMRLTGGFPASVHGLLSQLEAGHVTESDLEGLAASISFSAGRTDALAGLSEQERWTLGLLSASGDGIESRLLSELEVASETIGALLAGGWVQRETGAVRLVRACEGPEILDVLGAKLGRQAHLALARAIDHESEERATDSERRSRRVSHLALAGSLHEAEQELLRSEKLYRRDPGTWLRAVDALMDRTRDPEILLAAAAILEASGRSSRALTALQEGLRAHQQGDSLVEIHRQLGSCLLKLGDAAKALEQLELARAETEEPSTRAEISDLVSRAHIKRGSYDSALTVAREALPDAGSEAVRGDLEQDIGVAASYLGDVETARKHLAKAGILQKKAGRPRAVYLSLSYEAFNEYRAGDAKAAIRGYTKALAVAEENGMGDELVTSALNLGAACHQLGDLGRALDSYERGLPMATALGKVSTEATFRFNLAKLHSTLGLFERAERYADGAERLAESADLRFVAGLVDAVRGEIATGRSQLDKAATAFERAQEVFDREKATREAHENSLQLAEVRLLRGEVDEARRAVRRVTAGAKELDADDLVSSALLLRGRVLLARGKPADALGALEEAVAPAERSGQALLRAEIETLLGHAHEAQGATFLANRHLGRARELLERSAVGLPAHVREAFWSHPRRAALARFGAVTEATPLRERRLEQLLAINRKLNSSLEVRDVLEATMDAAIELTRAERGFLLVVPPHFQGEPSDVQVSVARNLDREKIGRSHLKFSRTIADRVLDEGEPVITVDARSDTRFAENASVHAMKLKSVVCVPIRAPGGVLGALYLDNRFQRGRFEGDDLEVLLAFADQAALALTNARLHDELRERSRALEEKSNRVEELARGQAQRIDALVKQVQTKQEVLEHRYDYGQIVGRSPAMQRVFSVLDRVIDVSATLLIQGESGTGKELIARTAHFNSPRRRGPFVAINCGALPATLLETELFGHVRGAFTGAERDREGLFVSAKGGTLFLDELGETPASMQVKLLRVLEQREVRPVGATRDIPIDIRLVCATNRSIRQEVEAGRFREDLFYRLGVVELELPPLRERYEDVPELAKHILARLAGDLERPHLELTPDALRALLTYEWPGNVRQLENVLTKALLLAGGEAIEVSDLSLPTIPVGRADVVDRQSFEADEGARILAVLRAERWNVSKVARILGIPRPTLYRKMKRLGIKRDQGE